MTAVRFLMCCCVAFIPGFPLRAQTSPSGTFKIESETKPEEAGGEIVSDFVVSTSDPKTRELLHEHADITGANYRISPDEKWIYDEARYGHKMCGGQIFKRVEGLKFKPVEEKIDDAVWRFFAKQEHLAVGDVPYFDDEEGIIDFVAWSPDSARVLLDLRVGDIGGDKKRGVYQWYFYFNTHTEKFEVTDYLQRLNKDAWKRWKSFFGEEQAPIFPEAFSAEPLDDLAPSAELKKQCDDADQRLNEIYQQTLAKIDQDQQKSLRGAQREWLKNRDAGAKFYKEAGGKSTPEQRYWQYLLDSTEAQLHHIETNWKSQTE